MWRTPGPQRVGVRKFDPGRQHHFATQLEGSFGIVMARWENGSISAIDATRGQPLWILGGGTDSVGMSTFSQVRPSAEVPSMTVGTFSVLCLQGGSWAGGGTFTIWDDGTARLLEDDGSDVALLDTSLCSDALIHGNRGLTNSLGATCFIATGSTLKAFRLYQKPGFHQERCTQVWMVDGTTKTRVVYSKPGSALDGCQCKLM